jgi:YVTN family beta-propeller protein
VDLSKKIAAKFMEFLPAKRFCRILAALFLLLALAAPFVGQTIAGTISKPGMKPYAVAVYEKGSKVFIADNGTGNLYMYDEQTLTEEGSLYIGKETYEMVVHEGSGKLYAASWSDKNITVVDASTCAFITEIDLGYGDLALDEELGKVYSLLGTRVLQIDIKTDSVVEIPNATSSSPLGMIGIAVNPVTHEVFISNFYQLYLDIINGVTLQHTTQSGGNYPHGPGLGVNWLENKVYTSYGYGVGSAFLIMDRDSGAQKQIYPDNDSLSFIFNPNSNRIYGDSEVNAISTIIEGDTDEFFNLPMLQAAAALGIRYSTNHIYFANDNFIIILDDKTQLVELIKIDDTTTGGLVISQIAVNQTTGRVYVINDGVNLPFVTVLQDTETMSRLPIYVCRYGDMYVVDPVAKEVVDEWYMTYPAGGKESFAIRPGGGRVYVPAPFHNVLGIYAGTGPFNDISTVETGGTTPASPAITPDGKYIYVPNSGSNDVGVIDVENESLLTTIAVGAKPWCAVVVPDGKKVYVTNQDDNSVSVIDTETKSVVKTISFGEKPPGKLWGGPWGLAANPSSTKVYVVNSLLNSVSVIDTASDTVIKTIEVGEEPHWAAVTPDGKKVYVTSEGVLGYGLISIIDTGTDTVKFTIYMNDHPMAVCARPDGSSVYVFVVCKDRINSYLIDVSTDDYSWTELAQFDLGSTDGMAVPDQTSKFAGRVTSGSKSISGASVAALQGAEVKGTATTNEAGDYSIFNLKPGTYDIEVSATGYESQGIEGQIVEIGRTKVVHFALPPPPNVKVASPNGGESWEVGSQHAITWTSEGSVGNVKILYSTNNGGTWTEIISSTANDGSYNWTVPDAPSTNCLAKVAETDDTPSDVSDAVFTIKKSSSGGNGGGDGSNDNGTAGKKCFIATAAYSSPSHPHLKILRDFRDKFLLTTPEGWIMVHFYYKFSPSAAAIIAKHKALRAAVRVALLPLVALSYSWLHFAPLTAAINIALIFLVFVLVLRLYRRK